MLYAAADDCGCEDAAGIFISAAVRAMLKCGHQHIFRPIIQEYVAQQVVLCKRVVNGLHVSTLCNH